MTGSYEPNERGEYDSLTDFHLPEFPLHLDVELTSRCNLNCAFCDKQPLLQRGQLGDIEGGLYRKIIDEAGCEGLKSLGLSYRGEPLLHHDVVGMVAYAKSRGIEKVFFCSNGMLLTPVMSERLMDAGLDRIVISAQGTNAHDFEFSRLGAKYHVVLRNINEFMKLRNRRRASLPQLWVQAVGLPELNQEEYVNFWRELCDRAVILRHEDSANRKTGLQTSWVCPQPWRRLTIEWDGTILPCNNDDLRCCSLGNAGDISIREAWTGEIMETLRRHHREGLAHKLSDCNGCPFRTAAIAGDKQPE